MHANFSYSPKNVFLKGILLIKITIIYKVPKGILIKVVFKENNFSLIENMKIWLHREMPWS